MTISQLKNRINTQFSGHGHFKVTIEFRGRNIAAPLQTQWLLIR
jgi:hypothetical protein